MEKNKRRKDLLEDHLGAIVPIARKITKTMDTVTPAIQKMRMPKRRTPDIILVAEAQAIAEGAAEYKQVFVAQQMPSDFEVQAKDAADALQKALNARDQSIQNHTTATGDAAHQASLVRSLIKVLHGMVSSRFHRMRRPDLIEVWTQVRRYPKKPGVKRRPKGTD
jgi:hypothetical protein